MKVLITDGTSYKSAVLAHFLKTHYPQIAIHLISKRKLGRFFHTKYANSFSVHPYPQDNRYLSWLKEYVSKRHIGLIIPVNSKEIEFLLANKEELSPCLDYMGKLDSFKKLNNKKEFSKLCEAICVPVPKTYEESEIPHLEGEKKLVVKPAESSSSKDVVYFNHSCDMKKYFASLNGKYIVQDYFEGSGGGISVFAQNGRIVLWYAHARILEYPSSGGSSTMRKTLDHPKINFIYEDAKKIIAATNWSGFCMFELKHSDNDYVFIESNPRIWGSIGQGLKSGTNYFSALLGNSKILVKNEKIVTFMSPLYFLSLFSNLIKGVIDISTFWKYRRLASPDISIFNDPFGYIGQFVR